MAKSFSLRTEILGFFLREARLGILQPVVTFFFNHPHRFLPVDRLVESTHWVAFHHPQPDYPFHVLIIPKQGLPSLSQAPTDHPDLYQDLILVVQTLIANFKPDIEGYRLITNGGSSQTIPQWHWHLISDSPGKTHA